MAEPYPDELVVKAFRFYLDVAKDMRCRITRIQELGSTPSESLEQRYLRAVLNLVCEVEILQESAQPLPEVVPPEIEADLWKVDFDGTRFYLTDQEAR